MKKLDIKDYVSYSNDVDENTVGGSLRKEFLRIDSNFFSDYFDIISSTKSSYQCYANDIIRDFYSSSDDKPIKYLSTLIKHSCGHAVYDGAIIEEVCSRIANFLDVPTVYNQAVSLFAEKCTLSLDFLSNGETIENLESLAFNHFPDLNNGVIKRQYNELMPIDHWCELISQVLNKELDDNTPNKQEKIDKVCLDFCLQYILKKLILCDEDFYPRNVAFIFSKDKTDVRLSPAHDYEYCRFSPQSNVAFFQSFINVFTYLRSKNSDYLDLFVKNLKNKMFNEDNKLDIQKLNDVVARSAPRKLESSAIIEGVVDNIQKIVFAYDRAKDNPNIERDSYLLSRIYRKLSDKESLSNEKIF